MICIYRANQAELLLNEIERRVAYAYVSLALSYMWNKWINRFTIFGIDFYWYLFFFLTVYLQYQIVDYCSTRIYKFYFENSSPFVKKICKIYTLFNKLLFLNSCILLFMVQKKIKWVLCTMPGSTFAHHFFIKQRCRKIGNLVLVYIETLRKYSNI